MTPGTPKPQVDTSKPHPARIYDYLLGGKDNYDVDRQVGERLADDAKRGAVQNRAFMRRAVDWVARSGVDQFLDIGTGIPTEPNLHQVVQRTEPKARVVYADNDPIVLRHAEALLISTPEGATDYVQADVREPRLILEHARTLLDFTRPVAVSLVALMHFIPDEGDPYGIVRTLVGALSPGSYLVLSHGTEDFLDEEHRVEVAGKYRTSGITLRTRTRSEIERFFDGLGLVDPGLVPAPRWYKDTPAPTDEPTIIYGGVALVP
ncbi:SAM-dependent methyltransferase [Streptomyces sp. NPDC051569]|uniref:SAM-dependent methyltransferase n=1 Tax=Streptomyces sp. NPDC051569 TaxID=3365661 RepID=UPI0037A2E458